MVAGASPASAAIDTTPPACALTAVIAGPPRQLRVTIHDTGSGVASIVVTESTNADTPVPPFVVGTTDPVVIVATKINQSLPARVALRATDLAGNVTSCDPVVTAVAREAGEPSTQTFTSLDATEHFVTVVNDDPGLSALQVEVNGKTFTMAGLRAGERRTLDVGSAMRPGAANTVSLTPVGKPGRTGMVALHD
jgi:hypothetical protein